VFAVNDIRGLLGRVEDWRVDGRLRWVIHRFRGGPQSGCHGHVSSPRHLERSLRMSRTTLTCLLRAAADATYLIGLTFGSTRQLRTPPLPTEMLAIPGESPAPFSLRRGL
jgi:hypothetical protein